MAPVTCLYAGCDYQTPAYTTEEEELEWLQMHDRACHNQTVILQQQKGLVGKLVENKLEGEPVENKPGDNSMNMKATDTMQGEENNAAKTEEIGAVSWEQGRLVEDSMDTKREDD